MIIIIIIDIYCTLLLIPCWETTTTRDRTSRSPSHNDLGP